MAHVSGHTSSLGYPTLSGRNPNSGRGTPAGWKSAADYGKAYGQQRKRAGVKTFGVTGKQWQNRNRGSRGPALNWGGMSGMFSNRDPGRFPAEDLAYQEKLREDVLKKTTPDVTGVGFQTKWRQKPDGTWELTSELDEKGKAIRDAAYTRQEMFLDQASALGAGGWKEAQQTIFDQKRALYAESDALAQQQRLEREQATGASSTGMFLGAMGEQEKLNRRNMLLEEQAFQQSQGLIDANLRRGQGAVTMMGDTANWANQYLKIPTADAKGNLSDVSSASTRLQDTLAAFEEEKAKSKNKFISNILDMVAPGVGTTAKGLLYG